MNVRKFSLLIGPFVMILAILACVINIGGPAFPDQHIPVSSEAASDLESSLQTAIAAGETSGRETLVITESQFTSYLAARLAAQAQPLFADPQVYLQNGEIQIYGIAQQGYFQANIKIVVTAFVDEQGQPKIKLTSADFGSLPVPAGLNGAISAVIQEAYTGAIIPTALGFRLESITVTNGIMTIVGRTK